MSLNTESQDIETTAPEENSFLSYVKRLEGRSDQFQRLLDETQDDFSHVTSQKNPILETEDFHLKKLALLQDIEKEERADLKVLEQLATKNEIKLRPGTLSAENDRTSALSFITFPADDDDPLQWNVDDFGVPTAKVERMAYQDLAALIEDQEQQDGRWSARYPEAESLRRPMSARLQNLVADNVLFYDRHSKPSVVRNDEFASIESTDQAAYVDVTLAEIEEETVRLKSLLGKQTQQIAEIEISRKIKAATTIQAVFKGYKIRKKHGTRLKQLILTAKKRLFEDRVRRIDDERQRLTELKQAEEMQRKAKLEEEKKVAEAALRKKEEEERRKQAELERLRLAREAEEKRKMAEQLSAEKARQEAEDEKTRLQKSLSEAEENKKLERAIGEAEQQHKLPGQQTATEEVCPDSKTMRQERETQENKEHLRSNVKQQESIRKSREKEKPSEVSQLEESTRHYPQASLCSVPAVSNQQTKETSNTSLKASTEKLIRSSTDRPRSRMKAEQRKEADNAYLMAKASFEEFIQEDWKPEDMRHTSQNTSTSDENLRKSADLKRESNNELRLNVQIKNVDRKPRFQVDSKKMKTVQMSWVKDCHPWSETVAQLKVSSTRVTVRQNSSNSRNAVRPPAECKAIPVSDLLVRAFGRSHPPVAVITCLVLSNLQSQFDLSALTTVSNLTCLDISNSNFSYLCNLDSLSRLSYLNASNNKIKDVELNKLESLLFLDLSHNELTTLSGVSYCFNLSSLNVAYNRIVRLNLTTLPSMFFLKLHSLDLSHNQLLSTREWLALMPSLVSLDVSSNNLRAIDSLASLGVLQFLNVSYNSLSELPDLSNCPLLIDAEFSGNNLHVIDSISKYFLPHLLRLNLARNMLKSLPDLSNLFNLIEVRVEHNQIIAYDALMKHSALLQLARLKFIRADFLCFNSDDAARLNDEFKIRRGVELISADYDDAIALCSTLKLLISSGLLEDEEDENKRNEPEDEYLEFARFVVLLQDNLADNLGKLADEYKAASSENKKKALASSQFVEQKWMALKTYFEESSKAAFERRYGVEFCGIEDSAKSQQANSRTLSFDNRNTSAVVNQQVPNINSNKAPNSISSAKVEMKSVEKVAKKSSLDLEKQEEQLRIQKQKEVELLKQRKRESAAIIIQSGWRGFLARYEVARWHVAATYIQKTWRGYWVRKQVKAVLEQFVTEPSGSNTQNETILEDLGDEFNDKSVDDLLSFLSSIQTTESLNLSARPGSRVFDKDGPHKVAWTTPTHSARGGAGQKGKNNASNSEMLDDALTNTDSPLPGYLAESTVPPVNLNSSTPNRIPSKKVQRLQEEWGFADPTTVELMIKRANRMKQAEKKQKMAKLDAHQRLALARKQATLESYRSPVATHQLGATDTSREQYPVPHRDVQIGIGIGATGRSVSPETASNSVVSTRQNQTFAWVHSVIREPSPSPLSSGVTAGFPPITTGGFMSQFTGTGVVTNRSSSNEHKRRTDDVPTFPPITTPSSKPNSATSNNNNTAQLQQHRQHQERSIGGNIPKSVVSENQPKKRDLIRAWREPAVRMSGGWGGGRSRKK